MSTSHLHLLSAWVVLMRTSLAMFALLVGTASGQTIGIGTGPNLGSGTGMLGEGGTTGAVTSAPTPFNSRTFMEAFEIPSSAYCTAAETSSSAFVCAKVGELKLPGGPGTGKNGCLMNPRGCAHQWNGGIIKRAVRKVCCDGLKKTESTVTTADGMPNQKCMCPTVALPKGPEINIIN